MDGKKRYITQLTAKDLQEIAAAANMTAGIGIRITRNAENVEIAIDQQALACMIESYCAQKSVPYGSSPDPREMSLDLGA